MKEVLRAAATLLAMAAAYWMWIALANYIPS